MTKFTEGNFTITLQGPLAGGKTVAMRMIQEALEAKGYEVKSYAGDKDPVMDHTLSVRWRAD